MIWYFCTCSDIPFWICILLHSPESLFFADRLCVNEEEWYRVDDIRRELPKIRKGSWYQPRNKPIRPCLRHIRLRVSNNSWRKIYFNSFFLCPKFWIWMFVQWRNSQTKRKLESKAKVCPKQQKMTVTWSHNLLLPGIFPVFRPISSHITSSWSWPEPWTAVDQALCPMLTAWTTQTGQRTSATSPRPGSSPGRRRSRVRTMCVSIPQKLEGELTDSQMIS